MYSAKTIANYFLDKADEESTTLTPMKIIKLVYIAHGWYLAFTDDPLINDYVEAWTYGPVISSLYQEFKRYGSFPIHGRARERRGVKRITPSIEDVRDNPSFPIKPFLDKVWDEYKEFTAIDLSSLTHTEGTPWYWTLKYHGPSAVIDDALIREYYVRRKRGE